MLQIKTSLLQSHNNSYLLSPPLYFHVINDDFGPTLNAETDCEYVGIVRISKNFINTFKNRLEKMISSRDMNNWWEGVLYSFIEERMDIFHQDVEGIFWTEVDTPVDYKRLTDWTSPLPYAPLQTSVVESAYNDKPISLQH